MIDDAIGDREALDGYLAQGGPPKLIAWPCRGPRGCLSLFAPGLAVLSAPRVTSGPRVANATAR